MFVCGSVCMYKEPSLHELEELLKASRSPTLRNQEGACHDVVTDEQQQLREGLGEGEEQDCTEQDGS